MKSVAWLLILCCPTVFVGCANDDASFPEDAFPEYASIDIKNLSPTDPKHAGPYVLRVGKTKVGIPEVLSAKGAGITLSSIQRSSAKLVFEVDGIDQEIDVTAKGTRLNIPEYNTSLLFQFRCSSIPPFDIDAQTSDEVTVFRLSSAAVGNEFHGTPISSEMTGNAAELVHCFVSTFSDHKVVRIGGADCSPGDYGIRLEVAGRKIDCWFSFECGWMYVHDNDLQYVYGFSPNRAEKFRKKMEEFLRSK